MNQLWPPLATRNSPERIIERLNEHLRTREVARVYYPESVSASFFVEDSKLAFNGAVKHKDGSVTELTSFQLSTMLAVFLGDVANARLSYVGSKGFAPCVLMLDIDGQERVFEAIDIFHTAVLAADDLISHELKLS